MAGWQHVGVGVWFRFGRRGRGALVCGARWPVSGGLLRRDGGVRVQSAPLQLGARRSRSIPRPRCWPYRGFMLRTLMS